MKLKITIHTETAAHVFSTAIKAMKFLKDNKAKQIFFNNERAPFADLCELYQLELSEARHNKAQGL